MHLRLHLRPLSLLIASCAALCATSAQALVTDPLIEGAKLCTRQLPGYERQYGIPQHLLSAIASTESGRYHQGLKISLPWPWTINAEGKGYYFDSKEEAIKAASNLRARGVKSMDVGCMQVNLYHHPNAFANLDAAFEPANNVAYAAGFLRSLQMELGSWKQAAAAYHSRTPAYGAQYVSNVYNRWYNILDRIRTAQGVVSTIGSSAMAMARPSDPKVMNLDGKTSPVQVASLESPAPVTLTSAEPLVAPPPAPKRATKLGEQAGRKLPTYKPLSMKMISVRDEKPRREHGIIVVRPDETPAPPPAPVAEAPAANEPKVIQVSAASGRNAKSGPRFIFSD